MTRFTLRSAIVAGAGLVAGLALASCTTTTPTSTEPTATGSSAKPAAADLKGTIYYMIPQTAAERFEKYDSPNIEAALKELAPNVEYKTMNANGEVTTQQSQVEAVIASKPLAVIFGAANTQQSGGMLAALNQAGIPVINYASQADGGPLNALVTVPFSQIGEVHGKYIAENLPSNRPVRLAKIYGDPGNAFYDQQRAGFDKYLEPLIANGTVKVVCESDALGFSPQAATTQMEQCLQKTNNGVDAVLGMNDGTLTGVAAAIEGRGLADKITIYGGYDATLEAVQRVAAGTQPITMAPPYKDMAQAAVQLALSEVSTEEVPADLINGTFNNNFADIPTANLDSTVISADNLQTTVVDSGLFTKEQICAGVAASSDFCQK